MDLSSIAIMIIIAFIAQTILSSIRACVQFARGKSHINGIESFRDYTFHAPLAEAAKGGGLNLMDALLKFWVIPDGEAMEVQSQRRKPIS